MKKIVILVLILMTALMASSSFAANRSVQIKELQAMRSEKRVALVIGNGAYSSSPLKNPVNDARLVSRTLKDLGFEVISQENASLKQMMLAINDFGKKIKGGGVGLFYYAGHGMQANGRNYLIPVGASINSESEMEFESVDAGRVLAKMEDAGNRVNIIVLDACRDNPFSKGFRSSSRGLAQISAPEGSYIAYAAKPGMVASDGAGSNGVFTEEFVKAIREEGLEINDAFRQVRSAVIKRTDKKQVPHTEETVTGHFYFKVPIGEGNLPGAAETAAPKSAPAPAVLAPKAEKKAKKEKKRVQVAQAEINEPAEEAAPARPAQAGGGAYRDAETGMEFVLVKGGCFQMGDTFGDGGSDEKPVHEVCVDDYYIGKYEATQEQWRKVVGNNPSHFTSCGGNCPVEQVSWNDVKEFIRILNMRAGGSAFRLPTEAEWEYAARSGGKSEKYSGGNDLDSVAWYSSNSGNQTHAVGQKRPNGLGIYDMTGNVWEWVEDWYDEGYYRNSQNRNPQGPSSGSLRVLRGGSWFDSAASTRAADRDRDMPVHWYGSLGFRLVRTK